LTTIGLILQFFSY